MELRKVTVVATILLLVALPLLLWPLLRPAGDDTLEPAIESGRPASQPQVQLSIEEVNLDLATGRIDQAEADRRISDVRAEAKEVPV